jgi:1-acyl-sn-glycerol-3-phosphate acyltransferase
MSSVPQPEIIAERDRRRLSRLRSYLVLNPLIYLYTIVLGTLSLLSSFFDRNGTIQHGFARAWSFLILKTAGIHVQVVGKEKLPNHPAVYAVNHASALDIPTLYWELPVQFRIMAKKELFRYPFMGWHLRRSGQIPIERENARSSLRSLNRASEALRSGIPLLVFPEGGRTADGTIKPFLSGAFYVAIKAEVDVVPIVLIGTRERLPMNSFHIVPGDVQMIVGDPISTHGLSPRDMDTLAARVQTAMEDVYYPRAAYPDPRVSNSELRELVPPFPDNTEPLTES